MSAKSGLTDIELAVLEAVDSLTNGVQGGDAADDSEGRFCRTQDVLDRVEVRCGLGPRYALPLLADLIAVWVRHLPLVEGEGNWGQIDGDPPADARYTRLALSAVGKLALAAEREQVGPVPLAIIEGSLYRGGPVPPFDPAEILEELMDESGRYCLPSMPTGTVSGDLDRLLRGDKVRLQLGARIRGEPGKFVITSPPFRVGTSMITSNIQDRVTQAFRSLPEGYVDSFVAAEENAYRPFPPPISPWPKDVPVVDVVDVTSGRTGVAIELKLVPDVDVVAALDWLRAIWPVTVEVDCILPAPIEAVLKEWDAGDGTGLAALRRLIAKSTP